MIILHASSDSFIVCRGETSKVRETYHWQENLHTTDSFVIALANFSEV
jgi:hypothetical protein